MKISELAEAPLSNDEALIAYDFVDGQPCRHMPIGEYLRRHKPIYTHRNGETEPPTVKGNYWFKGILLFIDSPGREREETSLVVNVSLDFMLDKYVGRWWGPVMPPWENK